MNASALASRARVRSGRRPRPGRPRAQACSRTETAAGSEARAAAPTAAYWSRSRDPALTFHGTSSASRSSQDVPSSSNSPAFSAAARTAGQRGAARPSERPTGPGPVRRAEDGRAGRGCQPPLARGPRPLARRRRAGPRARRARRRGERNQQHRARAHVLLLAQHGFHAVRAVGVEGLVRVLEQVTRGPTWRPGSWSAAGTAASAGRSRTGSSPPGRPRRARRGRRPAAGRPSR